MAPLPGGPADKFGGRYEQWRTVWRLADLLSGDATTMRLEPPNAEGEGVEFWIESNGQRAFEQVKSQGGGAGWTLAAMIKNQALVRVGGQLAAGHRVTFVLRRPAEQLRELSERARLAVSVEEFLSIISNDNQLKFLGLASSWAVDHHHAWKMLKKVVVESHSLESMIDYVLLRLQTLVIGDPATVAAILDQYLSERTGHTVTGPSVWAHLGTRGYPARRLSDTTSAFAQLRNTVDLHEQRVQRTAPGTGLVGSPHSSEIVQIMTGANAPRILLIHGAAGSGKSTVAARVLRDLAMIGWFAAAVRMDAAVPEIQTAARLGALFDLRASPTVLLAEGAGTTQAVLLVDQLDAVSTLSGRMSDVFESVAQMIREAAEFSNIHILLVVRTPDLLRDPRLSALLTREAEVKEYEIGRLSREAVLAGLETSGTDPSSLWPDMVEMLRTPIHYAVFSRLNPEAKLLSYRTLSDLYEAYTANLDVALDRYTGWRGTLQRVVAHMSDSETLHIPVFILKQFDQPTVAALVSNGVIVRDEKRASLFHETYFDYLFAEAFLALGNDLLSFVVESGQALFRRAQLRQLLLYLAAVDRVEFRRDVRRILVDKTVRPHLQLVVFAVLSEIDPDNDDWMMIESLAADGQWFAIPVIELLSNTKWFDAADSHGRVGILLSGKVSTDLVVTQLSRIRGERANRVIELVRPYVGISVDWTRRLRQLVRMDHGKPITMFTVELIDAGLLELEEDSEPYSYFDEHLIYVSDDDDADNVLRTIGAQFRRSMTIAKSAGFASPFVLGAPTTSLRRSDLELASLAERAPETFLAELLPVVIDIAEQYHRIGSASDQGPWRWRYKGDGNDLENRLLAGAEIALAALISQRQGAVTAYLVNLMALNAEPLRFLCCRTLRGVTDGDIAINWLLSDEQNLQLGYTDSGRWASRELIASATMTCSRSSLADLVQKILTFVPDFEASSYGWKYRGSSEYELLDAIDSNRRPEEVTKRLAELRRKFGDALVSPPRPITAHFVGSPIPTAATRVMGDEAWLRAIKKHDNEKTNWSGDLPVGGASSLAMAMGEQCKMEPERFCRLALRFDIRVPATYFEHVIRNAEGASPQLISELCLHARDLKGAEVGRAVCSAIGKAAKQVDDRFLELLEHYSNDPDPATELARVPTGKAQEYYFSGDLEMAGLNSTRGAAARALALVLTDSPHLAGRLYPAVVSLARDPVIAVRTQAAEAVLAIFGPMKAEALSLAEVLLSAPDDVFCARSTTWRLLRYALFAAPERFGPYLNRALVAPAKAAGLAGAVWADGAVNGILESARLPELQRLGAAARKGVADAVNTVPHLAFDVVASLFEDEDADVRECIARSMRRLEQLDADGLEELIARFIDSPSFAEHFNYLFSGLADARVLLPPSTLAACEKAVKVGADDFAHASSRRGRAGHDVVSVILRLYRQGDNDVRVRCLDLVDELSVRGAFGLMNALQDER